MADALAPLLADGPPRTAMLEAYAAVARQLGEPGAAARAAQAVLEELR